MPVNRDTSHWDRLYEAWARLPTPVGVSPYVVAGVKSQIAEIPGRCLLLGLTAGLAELGSDLTALERSETAARKNWPGDTPARRAVIGDWLQPPFAAGSFSTCFGDGCLIACRYPDGARLLFEAIAGVLRPGGRFVCRVFLALDPGGTIAAVTVAAWRNEAGSFHGLKFRLAMALVAERGDPNVDVQSIHAAFESNFPDRDRLAAVTGWDRAEIDTIDVYRSSAAVYSFPTSQQCLSVVPAAFKNARFVVVGSHELAMGFPLYPLLVLDKA